MTRFHHQALRLGGLAALLLAAACDLDETPRGVLTPENFYRSESDAVAAVTAAYEGMLGQYLFAYWFVTDIATDDFGIGTGGGDMRELNEYKFSASHWAPGDVWSNSYRNVKHANVVLDRVPAIPMNEALKNRLLGEVRFIRAYSYFNLVRLFGDVPLVEHEITSPAQAEIGRTPAEEVYALIISDLQQAAQVLPDRYSGADVGRVTRGAARALLAKVYLTRGDWTNAARTAGEIIASGVYALNEDWKDNFRVARELTNPESIFEINFDHNISPWWGGSIFTLPGLPSGFPGGDAWGNIYLRPQLVALYASGDARGQGGTFMVSPFTYAPGRTFSWGDGHAYVAKYFDEQDPRNRDSRSWLGQDNNWIVLRYADVLLMYAEALVEGGAATAGSAEQRLNQVRVRAGLAPVTGLGQTALRDSIRLERRREFVWEGNRWFDLKRWGLLDDVMGARSDLMPIPQREIDLNPKLSQNPGW